MPVEQVCICVLSARRSHWVWCKRIPCQKSLNPVAYCACLEHATSFFPPVRSATNLRELEGLADPSEARSLEPEASTRPPRPSCWAAGWRAWRPSAPPRPWAPPLGATGKTLQPSAIRPISETCVFVLHWKLASAFRLPPSRSPHFVQGWLFCFQCLGHPRSLFSRPPWLFKAASLFHQLGSSFHLVIFHFKPHICCP